LDGEACKFSPILTTFGQFSSVFAKNGFVTPIKTFGLTTNFEKSFRTQDGKLSTKFTLQNGQ